MSDLNIALIMKLVDRITAPSKAVISTLNSISKATQNVGQKGVAWSNRQLDAISKHKTALRGEAMGVAALGYSFFKAMQPAIEFEKTMAGVSKVLDFDTPQGLKDLEKGILKITTSGGLPMAANQIAEIIEAAGQAGVVDSALPDDQERAQLIAFATDAAKMGIAFDLSAEQAGEAMAQWRKAMKLTQPEALALGDAINHLSNNMNAKAPAIVDMIRRQGAVARSAGLTEIEVAGLSAALLSGGAAPEVAATGMKNFLNALTKGTAMTKRQSGVLKKLGIDATDLSKRMQVDAKGAIIDVLEQLAKLPDHVKNSNIGMLFGEESKGAIMPLLSNIDLLRESFNLVADETFYAGSMLEEYEKQSKTTANAIKLTSNYTSALAIAAGSVLLPEINELLSAVQPMVQNMIDWAQANPELISQISRAAAMLLVFKVASIGVRFALLTVLGPVVRLIRLAAYLPAVLGVAGTALRLFGVGLRFVGRSVLLVGRCLRIMGAAAVANPLGIMIAAIALAAYVIYDNWGKIVAFFKDKIDTVKAAFNDGIINGVFAIIAEFNPFVLVIEGMIGLVKYINTKFSSIDLTKAGSKMIKSMWTGAKSMAASMVKSISNLLQEIMPPWMLRAYNWVKGNKKTNAFPTAVLPGRDNGGPIRAGASYLVGERGPERFISNAAGSIVPTRTLKSVAAANEFKNSLGVLKVAMAASALATPALTYANAINIDRRPALSGEVRQSQKPSQINNFTINIHAQAGADEQMIADMVRKSICEALDQSRNLDDGVHYD